MYVKFEKCIIDTLKYKVSYRLSTYLMVKRIFTQNIGHLSLNKSCKLKFILENDFQNIPGRQANKKTYRVDSHFRIFTKNVGCMALIKPRKSRFSLAIHRESLKEGELKSSFTTKKNQNF